MFNLRLSSLLVLPSLLFSFQFAHAATLPEKGVILSDCSLLLGDGLMTQDFIQRMQTEDLAQNPDRKAFLKLLRRTSIQDGFINESLLHAHNNYFSSEIRCDGVVDQHNTGTCWYQATNNLFRTQGYDGSVSYAFFYHLLNQANQHFQNVIASGAKSLSPKYRSVLTPEIQQGGFFQIATQLVAEYGTVPRNSMPYSQAMNDPTTMLKDLTRNASVTTTKLVRAMAKNASKEELAQLQVEGNALAWKTLSAYLGTPPTYLEIPATQWPQGYAPPRLAPQKIDVALVTPKEYGRDILMFSPDRYITVSAYPLLGKNKYYAMKKGSPANTEGESYTDIKLLNLTSDRMRELTELSLSQHIAVPFAADISVDTDNTSGIMHPDIFEHSAVLGLSPEDSAHQLTREEANYFRLSVANHEMLLIGQNIPEGETRANKFKVEQSWGVSVGNKGFFTLYTQWWPNVYEVSIRLNLLSQEEQALVKGKPHRVNHSFDD